MTTKSQKLELIAAKITALQAKYAEVEASNEIDDSTVQAGAVVEFLFGRGDKKRTYTGKVLARKSQEKGADVIRVQIGEGFDAMIETALVSWVTAIVSLPAAEATE